jgi:AraC-like DNA-binding protein
MEDADRIIVLDQARPAAVIAGTRSCSTEPVAYKSVLSAQWLVLRVGTGTGWCRGAGYEHVLRPGTLLSLPPGRHDFQLTPDHEFMLVAMREPEARPQKPASFCFPLVRELSRFENKRWQHRLEETAHAVVTSSFGEADALALRAELFDLQWLPARTNNRQAVYDALGAMWEDAAQPLRLSDLAAKLGYTANYLNDLTRTHTGRSLGRWLMDMRMSVARGALAYGDAPIAEVGAAAGYDDPAYFSRAFRRAHDVSPAVWRIAHRPQDPRHSTLTLDFEELKEIDRRMAIFVS